MSDFVIDLATLRNSFSRVEAEAPARDVGLAEQEWPGPVRGAFQVERSGERVTVRGSVTAVAHLECVRCLRPFELEMTAPIVVFAERTGSSDRDEEDQLERDEYMMFHDGRRLDLREETREALMLELPISPHCREDCPGLCPNCGADLNAGPCECAAGEAGAPRLR